MANGSTATTAAITPYDVNIGARNPDRIFSRVCPATKIPNRDTLLQE